MAWSISEVKAANTAGGFYFFSRDTMRFFGDTMRSFAVRHRPDGVYVQRVEPPAACPSRAVALAMVGKLWRLDPVTGNLKSCEGEG